MDISEIGLAETCRDKYQTRGEDALITQLRAPDASGGPECQILSECLGTSHLLILVMNRRSRTQEHEFDKECPCDGEARSVVRAAEGDRR